MSHAKKMGADGHTGLEGASGRQLGLDATFHLLQNERRRMVLRYLLDQTRVADTDGASDDVDGSPETIEMRDLAEQVAAWEHETTVKQLTSDERQRVYIGLYQSHLPTLAEHGVIEYEQSRGRIEPTPLCAELEPYLGSPPESGAPTTAADANHDHDEVPADADAASTDGSTPSVSTHHFMLVTALLVPLAVFTVWDGPTVALSGTLLAAVLVMTAVVGSGLDRILGRVLGQ